MLGFQIKHSNSLSSNYLDGVSITADGHHIWSFAAVCDCRISDRPAFIGDKYVCDGIVYRDDINDFKTCLAVPAAREIHLGVKVFLSPMTADIEVRIC